ncbi:DUF4381 domain-containing protein [Marinicella sp. W31]|uniref:DUF4381 domain-containing protein n=1 Tax=Marinicella sp. W31 TaxID=3023713 RepID=UPI0037576C5D
MQALELRDIKLPAEPGYWPLAPGWWVLIAIGLIALLIVLFLLWRQYRRYQQYQHMNSALGRIHHNYLSHNNQHRLAADVSNLLRRFVRYRLGHATASTLQGEQWLEFLNNSDVHGDFSNCSTALIQGPYDPEVHYDTDHLIHKVRDYFKYNSMRRRHHA